MSQLSTACPQITSFHSTSFRYNVDKGKKSILGGATVCVKLAQPPHVCVAFLWGLRFPPTSPRCARERNWCVCVVPVGVTVCAGVQGPAMEAAPVESHLVA